MKRGVAGGSNGGSSAGRREQRGAPVPRPSKLNDKLVDAICVRLRSGVHLDVAATEAGVDASTVRHWKRHALNGREPYASTFARFAQAEAESEIATIGHLNAAIVGEDPKLSLDATKFKLERRWVKRWARAERTRMEQELDQFLDRIEPLCRHHECPDWLWLAILEEAARIGAASREEASEAPGAASSEDH